MLFRSPATAAAVQEAILAPAVMAISRGPAAVQAAAARILAPMGIPAAAVQDRLVKDLVAPMPLTVADKAAVAAKAVVVVKILGSVMVADRLTAATMVAAVVKVATAAALAATRCIEVVEDVFVSSGEQEEAFLQQAQEICNVIINGKCFV